MTDGKVVMTGGAGFILSHVAERLAQTGREIVLFDNNDEHGLSDYTRRLLAESGKVHYFKGDVRDKAAVDAVIDDRTEIVHGQVREIGTGISTTVREIAELIISLTGSKSKIVHRPMKPGEVRVATRADLTIAKRRLGWEPKTSLEEGLRRTIRYYAGVLGAESRK